VTAPKPLPRGRIKRTPEDFVVEEIPAYDPCGEGDHLYVRFTKRGKTTDEVAVQIARAVGVQSRDVGIAGMKDKVAVTTQTISLPIPLKGGEELEARVQALAIDGVTVRGARRHTNKLRTGHLIGNRFSIVVSDIEVARLDEVIATLEGIAKDGLPNAFGPQRFGRGKDNAEKARAWLSGRMAAPRDHRQKRLLVSALQSELFNRVLDARVEDGTWNTPLVGDLVKRRHGHALFSWTGEEGDRTDEEKQGKPFPTGPMFGSKMRDPEGEPFALEQRVLREGLGEGVDLASARNFGEGTRRPLCLWLDDFGIERTDGDGRAEGSGFKVRFVLPKGGYATSVLGAALALDEGMGPSPIQPPETDVT
jgi:tRNA pseudouridine13 synthase